ncbi:MAG: septal ring lytic transglycosylase RlpA family protein [Terriglobia bacterium]
MACGEPFNEHALTAAHRTLPLGTEVRVTNLRNGRSVDVKIKDRGPGIAGRAIDLSRAAARRLGFTHRGLAPVRIRVVSLPRRNSRSESGHSQSEARLHATQAQSWTGR